MEKIGISFTEEASVTITEMNGLTFKTMRAIKNTVYLAFGSSSNKLFLFDYIGLNSQYITTTFSELH